MCNSSRSQNGGSARILLSSVAASHSVYNWDGDGAYPVTEKVLENARSVLEYAGIPEELVEIDAHGDGHIVIRRVYDGAILSFVVAEEYILVQDSDSGVMTFERMYTPEEFIEAYRGPVWMPM